VVIDASLGRGVVFFFRIAIRRGDSDAARSAVRALLSRAETDAMTSLRHKDSMA
jgi:hypothetical protein